MLNAVCSVLASHLQCRWITVITLNQLEPKSKEELLLMNTLVSLVLVAGHDTYLVACATAQALQVGPGGHWGCLPGAWYRKYVTVQRTPYAVPIPILALARLVFVMYAVGCCWELVRELGVMAGTEVRMALRAWTV